MLFLASLSEFDARWWLGSSELLLLAATILLVAGLIGEWSDSESWKKRKLYKLAKLAVILGVAGEFFGDAGIFETSARLQTVDEAKVSNANTKAADAIERAARVEQAALRILDRERFKTEKRTSRKSCAPRNSRVCGWRPRINYICFANSRGV
jgi:hypothetical protein